METRRSPPRAEQLEATQERNKSKGREMNQTETIQRLEVEEVALGALRPDPANPRKIDGQQLDALTASMKTYGIVQPILARREDGVVIGGHQRLVAAGDWAIGMCQWSGSTSASRMRDS